MNDVGFPILSVIVFLPLLGAIILALFFRAKDEGTMKGWTLAVMLVNFVVSLGLLLNWQSVAGMQFVENASWVAAWESATPWEWMESACFWSCSQPCSCPSPCWVVGVP
jgi:NADH:ubiquinone oxidoreductase subunit 5 (subunit L)/multisubunit Na+/H+ antiporter MnhA subunit